MKSLKRVEIIANHSVESDIMEALNKDNLADEFTRIPSAHGRGHSEPKQGDSIWPEENFVLIIYCSLMQAEAIEQKVEGIRELFPDEGIRCFVTG